MKYGSYQHTKIGGYIYRTEYIPSIKCCLEIYVRTKPNDSKRYREYKTKRDLTEIQRLKQRIRKLNDKLYDEQKYSERYKFSEKRYCKSIISLSNKNKEITKFVKTKLKKNCGKVLSEKTYNELLDIIEKEEK